MAVNFRARKCVNAFGDVILTALMSKDKVLVHSEMVMA